MARSVVAGLVGDWAAAADVQLELPETGVCGVPATVDANGLGLGSACCGSQPKERASTLIPVNLSNLSFTTDFTADIDLAPAPAAGSCCGVTACCTDEAPVAADACCTPETKQANSELVTAGGAAKVTASSCCG